MTRPTVSDVQRVAVIGAGTIGTSWAAYFLAQALDVLVVDPVRNEADLRHDIADAWIALERMGLAPGADLDRLCLSAAIDSAVAEADFVQENVPERLAVKRETLHALEAVLRPDVVVSSSTTSMLPSAIQDGAARPQRVLVGHPFNPPHLIPLVEVAGGKLTARETLDWAVNFYRAIGKVPVLMKKEAVGHLANRLTSALFREAVHLVAEGYTTVEDIDEVVTSGPGLRWALQGPFTTYHLAGGRGGIAHYMRHIGPTQQDRWQSLGNPRLDDELSALIVRSVEAMLADTTPAQLASLRDEGLLQLLRPKSGQQS